jgi:hypothetical protein
MRKKKQSMPDEVLEFFRKKGQKGGRLGGYLRWQGVSAEERSKIMRAVRSRKKDGKRKSAG